MNTKTLVGFIVVIAVLGGAAYFIGRQPGTIGEPPPPPAPPPPLEKVVSDNWNTLLSEAAGPPRGNTNAPWTLIECGDFECPNCGKARPVVEQFVGQSGGKVKLYFVNFPLRMIHKHAEEAAEASLAASAQGKFWPMYDMLYGDQDSLVASEIEYHASSIPGLDAKKFTADMDSKKYAVKVNQSEQTVASSGIASTPTFLLRSSSGGKVYCFIGLDHNPKYKNLTLGDLVQHPPWKPGNLPGSATVAAKPAGADAAAKPANP